MLPYERSFASHPMAEMWSDKNEKRPQEVTKASHQFVIFDCKYCKHSFDATPNRMRNSTFYCPYCSNKKLCGEIDCDTCFVKSYAAVEKSCDWNYEKNKETPLEVAISSHKKYYHKCDVCKHDFLTSPNYVDNGNYCPYCGNSKLCGDINCDNCLEKSFAFCEFAINWSEKNGDLSPIDVFKSSHAKKFFNCPRCNHVFEAALSDVNSGYLCSYCANKKFCNDPACITCYLKSFASSPYAKFWSAKNNKLPNEVFKNSEEEYYFYCWTCNHEFKRKLLLVTNRCFCLYCSNHHSLMCDDNTCNHCFNKSFASHKMAKYWSSKNKILPRDTIRCSSNKYIFDCPECKNEFSMALKHINNGSWCPCIKRKTEKLLQKFLEDYFKDKAILETGKTFKWCKNIKKLPFDFFIRKYKIIIELDGDQHFIQVSIWTSPDKTQKMDIHKMKAANSKGYSVIRIYQRDVFDNKNNWQDKLINAIELIKEHHQKFPVNILIGKIYDDYPIYDFQPECKEKTENYQ